MHIYFDAGPTKVRVTDPGMPPTVQVELREGGDVLQLNYTNLDALNELVFAAMDARTKLVQRLIAEAEETEVDLLGQGDVIVIAEQVATVWNVLLDFRTVTVAFVFSESGKHDKFTVPRHSIVRRVYQVPGILPSAAAS